MMEVQQHPEVSTLERQCTSWPGLTQLTNLINLHIHMTTIYIQQYPEASTLQGQVNALYQFV